MKIFSEAFKITKNKDDTYNIHISINDNVIITKSVSIIELERLYIDIENIMRK